MIVLYEDQQRINLFAKKNTLLNDIIDTQPIISVRFGL